MGKKTYTDQKLYMVRLEYHVVSIYIVIFNKNDSKNYVSKV